MNKRIIDLTEKPYDADAFLITDAETGTAKLKVGDVMQTDDVSVTKNTESKLSAIALTKEEIEMSTDPEILAKQLPSAEAYSSLNSQLINLPKKATVIYSRFPAAAVGVQTVTIDISQYGMQNPVAIAQWAENANVFNYMDYLTVRFESNNLVVRSKRINASYDWIFVVILFDLATT